MQYEESNGNAICRKFQNNKEQEKKEVNPGRGTSPHVYTLMGCARSSTQTLWNPQGPRKIQGVGKGKGPPNGLRQTEKNVRVTRTQGRTGCAWPSRNGPEHPKRGSRSHRTTTPTIHTTYPQFSPSHNPHHPTNHPLASPFIVLWDGRPAGSEPCILVLGYGAEATTQFARQSRQWRRAGGTSSAPSLSLRSTRVCHWPNRASSRNPTVALPTHGDFFSFYIVKLLFLPPLLPARSWRSWHRGVGNSGVRQCKVHTWTGINKPTTFEYFETQRER